MRTIVLLDLIINKFPEVSSFDYEHENVEDNMDETRLKKQKCDTFDEESKRLKEDFDL